MNKKLVVKSDHSIEITGTKELIPGRADILDVTLNDQGKFEIEWCGRTEMFWNDQRTVIHDGQRVFLDEDGREFLENELELIDATEEEEDA